VSWQRTSAGTQLECTVPPGVTATVLLPGARYGVQGPTAEAGLRDSGTESATTASAGSADGADGTGTVDFRIHPGTWTFSPAPAS
jgi:alpha-L-rhamnosidase